MNLNEMTYATKARDHRRIELKQIVSTFQSGNSPGANIFDRTAKLRNINGVNVAKRAYVVPKISSLSARVRSFMYRATNVARPTHISGRTLRVQVA